MVHTPPIIVLLVAAVLALISSASAFVAPGGSPAAVADNNCKLRRPVFAQQRPTSSLFMSTVIEKPGTEVERKKKGEDVRIPADEGEVRGPIEWLIDDRQVSREDEEPFHILLLDETFTKNDHITIEYVASSCSYVLRMPYDEAAELAAHAEAEGFSCLGTWSHAECMRLGRQLQNRDIVCRVVPFCEGGDRAWQARSADDSMKRAEDTSGWN